MLLNGSELIDTPIMSLQTGKELARTSSAIINPHNLKIIAYEASGVHLDHNPSYIRTSDIRELGSLGMIIDSSEEFVEPDDIISEKDIYELAFEVEGKTVIDEQKTKMGKVIGYVVEVESFIIQQIIVKKPLLKSFSDDELIIHRNQIVEVTDTIIIVRSGKQKERAKATSSRHYVNPFRQTVPQPESTNTK